MYNFECLQTLNLAPCCRVCVGGWHIYEKREGSAPRGMWKGSKGGR